MLARLAGRRSHPSAFWIHSRRQATYTPYNPDAEAREEEQVDVCIVGAGPAGLSAAIRLKQLEVETGKEIRVVVLEKGSEVGAHILSGAVVEPSALDVLLPDWRLTDHPLSQPVTSSSMRLFTSKSTFPIPHPPQMNNKGNYVTSLSRFASWLGGVAEELGVEIYPGFAGARFLLSDELDATDAVGGQVKSVRGVVTHDAGLTRQRTKSPRFEPGIAFRARATLLAEGAHGSLSKTAISTYNLRHNAQPQTYGIGLKEVWRIDPSKHVPGKVVHTIGWPMDWSTYGGGWEYHMADGLVSIGLVVGLDYKNPYLEPYREFQRMKHHPYYRNLLASGERLAYGARSLTEGGIQCLPRLDFPGGALLGCSAGVVNTAKIKGTHNAMRTGMLAAETAFAELHPGATFVPIASPETFKPSGSSESTPDSEIVSLAPYNKAFVGSPVYKDLWTVRNVRPAFGGRFGTLGGVLYAGLDTILGGRVPWTLKHHGDNGSNPSTTSPDALATLPAAECKPIEYPPFEPPLSTDLMSSVSLTGTNHAEGQPVHLRVMKGVDGPANTGVGMQPAGVDVAETPLRRRAHVEANAGSYAGLLQKACPAGVYEYVSDDGGKVVPGNLETTAEEEGWDGKKLVINSQNCIHCKLCDIKVPTQDITWTVPEGGGGPKYTLT
ncbi:Electron transfer flavoprotein-ubiquinone oxidoreductase [Mycena indigotica]|uniref:Electron transfer flavoprotein-ubiquinone oxidoreductase n=1 Tax=Mycena indigotica TaxID=2126181 RepID=A0A8H6S074_9AGAR|nr:Electron transfer flavoprotein-ubiquinone oxidoreductase [Mycena indigotica]KAF7289913.1 Electron transfer flavoprotein-ubiquinone oxidoreductase [Mycena indigotica]